MKDYLTFVTLTLICIVCFYIKKRIYSYTGCKFCFHLSINTFLLWISHLMSAVEPEPNEQKNLKTM